MKTASLILVCEGSGDRALLAIIRWLAVQHLPEVILSIDSVNWSRTQVPGKKLVSKIATALELYPDADLLLIHRDADREDGYAARVEEIDRALGEFTTARAPNYVRVIPVQETEAWLLFDEAAIRSAAANPNGTAPLELPKLAKLESVKRPKEKLHAAIAAARAQKSGRKARIFDPRTVVLDVALYIESSASFAPLRQLPAFSQLEADIADFARVWLAANPPEPDLDRTSI